MKKLVTLSVVAAALLFVGCGEKKEQSHTATAKAQSSSVVQHEVQKAKKQVIEEPLPGTPVKAKVEVKKEAPSSVAHEQAASQATEEAKESVVEKAKEVVEEAKEAAKEKAAQAVAAVTGGTATAAAAQAPKEEAAQDVVTKAKEKAEEATEKAEEAKEKAAEAGGAEDLAKGKELFGKCASCHGADGKRKALGKSAPIAGMSKDEVVKILKEYKAGTLNKYGMGALMKGQVAGLSDEDIEALAAYIASLK